MSALFLTVTLLVTTAVGFQTKEFSETVPFTAGDSLTIETYKGSIHVSTWDRSEVSIFARIAPPEGEPAGYAAEVVEATRVQVRRSNGRVSIKSDNSDVPSKRSGWLSRSRNLAFVHYEIKAPRNAQLNIEDYKSDIEIYDLVGDVDVETYKGTLKAADLDGEFRLDTYKGRADLSGIQGRVDIETYKGEIGLQALNILGDSRLETYKGSIELEVPADQGFDLVADLGKSAALRGNLVEALSRGNRRDKHFRGSINSGGPRLEITSHRGNIRLSRR